VLFGWIIGGLTLFAGLYGLYALRREWRGAGDSVRDAPDWWPFDPPAWRGLLRSAPVGALEAPFAGAAIIVSELEGTPATDAVGFVLYAAVILTFALFILVGLFNRPAALVAPRFRAFPGAIDEWRGVPIPADGATEARGTRDASRRRSG
jgi:hypothetical protein